MTTTLSPFKTNSDVLATQNAGRKREASAVCENPLKKRLACTSANGLPVLIRDSTVTDVASAILSPEVSLDDYFSSRSSLSADDGMWLTQADPDRAISESGSSRGSHTASYHGSPQSARLLLDTSEEEGSLHLDKGSVENLGVGSASDRLQDWHSRLEEDQLSFGSSSSQDARDMEELLGLLSGEFVSPQPRAPDDVEILSGATPTLDADGVIMRDSQGNLILNSGHAKPFKVFV